MGRVYGRLRAIACAWFVCSSAACGVPAHGEWDPRQCSDGLDNDADGRIDCDDPDCWAYVCAEPARDAGLVAAGGAGAAGLTSHSDAGRAGAAGASARMPMREDDAGMPPQDQDAGAVPAPECTRSEDCGSGRQCVSGKCHAPELAGTYVLTALSAVVPARTALGTCFDPDVWCSLGPCDGSCQPDPYVVVTKNGVLRVGTTSTVTDSTRPSWQNLQLELQLVAGDSLLFGVWDADTFGNSELFSCSPQLQSQLPGGSLRCTPSSRTDGAYEISATLSRR